MRPALGPARARDYFQRPIARRVPRRDALRVADPLLEREEIVALLFNVSDIAVSVDKIVNLLEGGDDEEEEEVDGG
jgi:hypothetical protein